MTHFKFSDQECMGEVSCHPTSMDVTVMGVIQDTVRDGKISYIAACPIDRRSSWTGSGLPFANSSQAFYNTPNKGTIELGMFNKFDITFKMPNSYYIGLGSAIVPPSLFIQYNNGESDKTITIKLSDGVPFRMLTYPTGQFTAARSSPNFYGGDEKLEVRTQEKILLDSEYPKTFEMPKDFWGARPRR